MVQNLYFLANEVHRSDSLSVTSGATQASFSSESPPAPGMPLRGKTLFLFLKCYVSGELENLVPVVGNRTQPDQKTECSASSRVVNHQIFGRLRRKPNLVHLEKSTKILDIWAQSKGYPLCQISTNISEVGLK